MKDKAMILLLHLVCMSGLWVYLRLTGYHGAYIVLILIFWALILGIWLSVTFIQRRKFFREAERILEETDQRYLLGELLPGSFRLEDQLYRDMIRRSGKGMIERVRRMEAEQKDYREYIENWVHEIKAPIANVSLICDNRRKERQDPTHGGEKPEESGRMEVPGAADFRTISLENRKIEDCVDMVLYFARSVDVYKDYLIRETDLEEIVLEVLGRNRLLLVTNHVRVETDCREKVYTDKKWIAFILNQLILNSVKYRTSQPVFRISAKRKEKSVILTVSDNGVGIRGEELSRIFEKGFTGTNGRDHDRSTGMGLYLSRKLCEKLGIGIRARSRYGEGTEVMLEFPVGRYIPR